MNILNSICTTTFAIPSPYWNFQNKEFLLDIGWIIKLVLHILNLHPNFMYKEIEFHNRILKYHLAGNRNYTWRTF